ncbi:hypothetical protein Sjap_001764 [Stephania japonica]|uniref:Uncharacterized protein n=1 Tax=Stephania japonica TaxID=461633 RepID=A0AAP0PTU3_9MAGN
MNQQEEGWPLGLQPLNMRVGLVRSRDFSGSISFNTLITGSPSSSTDSSSDLDTESTGSFFHDKSITLGSLIGASRIFELSGRSIRGRRAESLKAKTNYKSKTWLFSLCSKVSVDTESVRSPPSLGQFLEVERRAATDYRRNESPITLEANDFHGAHSTSEPNSLFVDGHVAPPQSNPNLGSEDNIYRGDHSDGHGAPVLLSCICGHPTS